MDLQEKNYNLEIQFCNSSLLKLIVLTEVICGFKFHHSGKSKALSTG